MGAAFALSARVALCQRPAQLASDSQAAERGIVEQFYPMEMLAEDARVAAERGGRSSKGVAFVAADLDGTGNKDYLVAVYGVAVPPFTVRVLKKEGSSAALVYELKRFMLFGGDARISVIDVDHSGHPGFVIQTRQTHGNYVTCFLRWDGTALTPFGVAGVDGASGYAYSPLDDAYFLDLDGDGILEIVNPPEFEPGRPGDLPETVKKYEIYKIEGDGYKLSPMFFDAFFELWSSPYETERESFVASQPGTPYIMTIANGDGRNIPPVTSARIELNGEVIAGPDKVNNRSRYLTVPVSVQTKNVINVSFTGPEGSKLYVGIGPAQSPAAEPAAKANR